MIQLTEPLIDITMKIEMDLSQPKILEYLAKKRKKCSLANQNLPNGHSPPRKRAKNKVMKTSTPIFLKEK